MRYKEAIIKSGIKYRTEEIINRRCFVRIIFVWANLILSTDWEWNLYFSGNRTKKANKRAVSQKTSTTKSQMG
jgi:hypothetical protein